ncbi:MAG: putative manganese transporter [Acidobacteriota bacterium]
MTELILATRGKLRDTTTVLHAGGVGRLAFVTACVSIALAFPVTRVALLDALGDAYLGVGVFVAATFAIVFTLESRLGIDYAALLERHRAWEVPIAAAMGALPGCGGAVMVMTQFAMGRARFGAVVAVLTATMGDAAFLVLARNPPAALALIVVCLITGTVSGYLVNAIHGDAFLRTVRPCPLDDETSRVPVHGACWVAWSAVAIPGLVIGIGLLLQLELAPVVVTTIGVVGGLTCVAMWALSPTQAVHMSAHRVEKPLLERVALNTNFVMAWVVLGFFVFALAEGADWLNPLLEAPPLLLPLVGILIGFLPGCGPQVLVTTLYLAGVLPFSAQLGNAISNDGDALFPAIAVAPRAAMVATLYTAVPALFVAYGFLLLFEMH